MANIVCCIAWTTAIGLVASQALIEYWKKLYVGPEKALTHGMFMLAFTAIFQLGIVLAPFVFSRTAKWRLLAVGLMLPVIFFLGHSIFFHITRFSFLVETLPIPPAVWVTQLVIAPLAMFGYVIVLLQLRQPRISDSEMEAHLN